jgi:hypothetical protein
LKFLGQLFPYSLGNYLQIVGTYVLRDRPFNLKRGGYGFLFRSEFIFRTTQELEYLFFFSHRARIFFPEFNIRLYDKNSESHYFFFPPPKSEYFFQQHWESEYFFRKKNHTPPPPPFKLNGRSLNVGSLYIWKLIFRCLFP